MCLLNSTNFRLFRAKYALLCLISFARNSWCKIMDLLIKTRKSDADVAVAAVNALILIFCFTRIKTSIHDFKDFIYYFDAFLKVFFCEIHLFNVIIASCKTDKSLFHNTQLLSQVFRICYPFFFMDFSSFQHFET